MFEDPLGELFILVDHQKEAESNSSLFEYRSPKAIDFQQDPIKMSKLKMEPSPPCGCFSLTINPNLTFSILVNTHELRVNDSGTYDVSILLSDQ